MKKGIIFNCCMTVLTVLAVNFAPTFAFGACGYSKPSGLSLNANTMRLACNAYGGTFYTSSFSSPTQYGCRNTCPSGKDTSECCCTSEGGTWSGGRCLEMSTTVNYPSTDTDQAYTDYPSSGSGYPSTNTTTTTDASTNTQPWTNTTTTATQTETTTTQPQTDTMTSPWTDTMTLAGTPITTSPQYSAEVSTVTYSTDNGGAYTTTPETTSFVTTSPATTSPATTVPETTSPATTSPETTSVPETTTTCEELLPET